MAVTDRARRTPILIVGAGPVGLATALELTRRGFAVRVVEKELTPSPFSRAIGINARTLDLLEPSGVTALLLREGIRITHANLRVGDEVVGRVDFARVKHRYNFLLSLPQLPEDIQYRFVGKHLILYDAKANLIIDFMLNAIA